MYMYVMYVCMDGWMDGWMYVCMYVSMYVCMYVYFEWPITQNRWVCMIYDEFIFQIAIFKW